MGARVARAGFTLMEVAVSAVLVGLLAAATVPTLLEFLDGRDAENTAKTLASIAAGIATYEAVVRTGAVGTNVYPRNISYLTNAITSGSLSSCGTTYGSIGGNASMVATYNANAPFVTFYIPPGGLRTPVGTISDQLVRNPASAAVGTLAIVMAGIDSMEAVRLERVIDGDDASGVNNTQGVFRVVTWTGTGSGTRTADVQYILPAAAKC